MVLYFGGLSKACSFFPVVCIKEDVVALGCADSEMTTHRAAVNQVSVCHAEMRKASAILLAESLHGDRCPNLSLYACARGHSKAVVLCATPQMKQSESFLLVFCQKGRGDYKLETAAQLQPF